MAGTWALVMGTPRHMSATLLSQVPLAKLLSLRWTICAGLTDGGLAPNEWRDETMRRLNSVGTIVFALAAILAVTGWTREGMTADQPRLITVTGDAEVRVVPDEVLVTLGVETWNADLQVARSENDQRVTKVLALVRGLGIKPEHIQTEHISVEPRYHDDYEKRGFLGFYVRKTVVVTLKDVTQFENLLTGALEAGATHVHGVQFRTTELRKYRDQARALAAKAAREKAEALAKELGQTVGEPQTIQEDQNTWWSWYGSWWGAQWGGVGMQNVVQNVDGGTMPSEGTFAPGQIAVNARVTVSFGLR